MAKIGQPSPQQQPAFPPQQVQTPAVPPQQYAQAPVQNGAAPFDPSTMMPQNGAQPQFPPPVQQQVQYAPPVAPPTMAPPPVIAPPSFGGQMGAAVAGPSPMQMLGGIDFSQVSESNFMLLPLTYPDGNPVFYEAIIDKIDQKPTAAGATMVTLRLKVTFPEFVGNTRTAGAMLSENITFGDKALWKLKGLLRSCGLLSDDGRTSLMKDWGELVGNVLRFQIMHDEFEKEGVKELRSKTSSGFSEGYETPGLSGAPVATAPVPVVAQPMAPASPQGVPNFGLGAPTG